jgi:polyhydroxybutyrate depolymerase
VRGGTVKSGVGWCCAVIAAVFTVTTGCVGCTAGHTGHTGHAKSAAPTPASKRGCGHTAPGGRDRQYVISVDPRVDAGARQRTAIAYIPASYRPGRPTPLVMEFHGAGTDATAAGYEHGSALRALADTKDFIDVFPQALRAPNGNLAWNAYGPVYWKVAEIPFVNKVLDAVAADYCVDPSRVYASGTSNGANMANYVACRDAARFAAIAPVAGPMFGQDDGPCAPSRPVPIIDIHSLNDPAVPYQGHPIGGSYSFPLPSVSAWLTGWAALDRCLPAPAEATIAGRVEMRTWSGCAGSARIVAYAAHAGHGWPATLDGRPAAEVVWAFLSAFGR